MPLMDELGIDGVDADADAKTLTAPPIPPEGDHHAVLCGFREIDTTGGARGRELTFKLVTGPGAGKEVKEALWSPKGESAEKDEKAKARMRLFAHRLGLLRKVPSPTGKGHTYQPVPGKSDFTDAFGTECVVRLRHEEREYTDGKGKLRKITEAKVEYAGLYTLDDPEAKGVKRGTPAEVAAATGGIAPPPTADQFADI